MSGFETTDGALQFAGSRLAEVTDDLESDFTVVRTQLDRLLDGGWFGGAARSFSNAWAEWLRGYSDAVTAMRSMAELLGETGASYASAEADTVDQVRTTGAELS